MVLPQGGVPASTRFGSELAARVVSAIVLAVVVLTLTVLGGWPFAVVWLVAGFAIAHEWSSMFQVRPAMPLLVIAGIGLLALSLAATNPGLLWPALGVASAALVALAAVGATLRDKLSGLAGFGCAAVIVATMPLLRGEAYGLLAVLWMFAVVWTTDIAAYFAGRRLGGPKLWPAISPKKTWSGALVGLAAGTLAGTAVVLAGRQGGATLPIGGGGAVVLSALASIAGQCGDLAESALKRRQGVKDSGNLIPGHGGVMDRLDALWAVALLAGCGLIGARLVQQ